MELNYGGSQIVFEPDWSKVRGVLIPPAGRDVIDVESGFRKAISHPVTGSSLREMIKDQKPSRIGVIVEDKTRKNPEYPALLDRLLTDIGTVFHGRIFLVVAYGSHPAHSLRESGDIYGLENLARVKLVDHNCRDAGNLVNIGEMSSGNPLFINKVIAEADLVISLGDITPHAFAGFSGGRKAILPGVSGYQTIENNHSLIREPGVGLGLLEGNPIHREMMEAANLAGLDYIINSVRNNTGKIVDFVSGPPEEAFYEGVRICKALNSVKIPERADVVYISCGGFPKDKSLYHAQRSVVAATGAVKKGGTIVVFGQFPEGVGDPIYEEWLPKPLPEILSLKREEIKLGVHSAYFMARNLSHAEILLYTEMDETTAARLHFRKVASLLEIDRFITEKHGPDYTAYVIPNGSQIMIEIGTCLWRQ